MSDKPPPTFDLLVLRDTTNNQSPREATNHPMTPTELKLQTIVAAKLQIDSAQVPLDQTLTTDLGLDSFDLMEVILEIEQAFPPLSLADEAAQNLKTLREVAAYIDSR